MEDLIKRIKQIANDLETFAWLLDSNENHEGIERQSISDHLEIYSDAEYLIREIFKELKENHGSEMV